MKEIDGQYSIFNCLYCVYSWNRYLGQKVKFWRLGVVGKIISIEKYYTLVKVANEIFVAAPNEIYPV